MSLDTILAKIMSQSNENPVAEFFTGLGLLSAWNILIMFMGITIPFIGLVQLLYVIPWTVSLYRREKWERLKGVTIGALITFLLNSACWLWVL